MRRFNDLLLCDELHAVCVIVDSLNAKLLDLQRFINPFEFMRNLSVWKYGITKIHIIILIRSHLVIITYC